MNKLSVFKTLMNNSKFVIESLEESIVRNAMIQEIWLQSSSNEKQKRRLQFLASGKKSRGEINLVYYEKLIEIYDFLIEIRLNLERTINEKEIKEENIELQMLRIFALISIEMDFIDEQLIPIHHIRPKFFQALSDEFNLQYPELRLSEFTYNYKKMFDLWPEKSKYEIKLP